MRLDEKYDIDQLRDYSSLFSRSEAIRWFKNDWSSLRLKINRYDHSVLQRNISYLAYLKQVYKVLGRFYPNEYVYKNEFIGKWLLKEIGTTNSVVYSELRLGKAVADLAIFNGISKVFEIKTLLDKEARLSNQLEQYSRIFNEIYLIVPEAKSHLYLKRDASTGIIIYDHTRNSFSLIRQARYKEDISVDVLMQVLHTHEYVALVEKYYGERPQFHDFNKFQVCKELIGKIPKEMVNKQFVAFMKARRIHNAFSKKESQFNQLFLSMNYTDSQKRHLLSNLSTTIC
jgi:hypothetical protein